MAAQKERELTLELVRLAGEVNDQGVVSINLDISLDQVSFRVSPIDFKGEWIHYDDEAAYFSGTRYKFKEKDFINTANRFKSEILKHHKSYDSDGVKL